MPVIRGSTLRPTRYRRISQTWDWYTTSARSVTSAQQGPLRPVEARGSADHDDQTGDLGPERHFGSAEDLSRHRLKPGPRALTGAARALSRPVPIRALERPNRRQNPNTSTDRNGLAGGRSRSAGSKSSA
jgi:hypothetical protein